MILDRCWGNDETRLRCWKCAPFVAVRTFFNLALTLPGITSHCNYNVINGLVNTLHKEMPMLATIACGLRLNIFSTASTCFPFHLPKIYLISHTTRLAERLCCKVPSLEREYEKQQILRLHHDTRMQLYKAIGVIPSFLVRVNPNTFRVFLEGFLAHRDICALSNLIRIS